MFHDSDEGRYPKSNAVLKSKLKVEVLVQGVEVHVVVLDGGGMLDSSIYWPKDGLVRDLPAAVEMYISKLLQRSDVYIAFDHYFEKSLKSDTLLQRLGNFNGGTNFELKHHNLPQKCACHL